MDPQELTEEQQDKIFDEESAALNSGAPTDEGGAQAPLATRQAASDGQTQDDGQTPLDDLSPGARKRFEELQHKLLTSDGRVGALTKALNQMQSQMQALASQLQADNGSVSADDIEAALASDPRYREFAENYPDVVELQRMREMAAAKARGGRKAGQQVMPEGQQAPTAKPDDAAREREENRLFRAEYAVTEKFPTWKKDVVQPEFAAWLNKQPPSVKAWADSQDPQHAIDMLTLFHAQGQSGPRTDPVRPTADPRRVRIESAREPRSTAVQARAADDEDPDAIWNNAARDADKRLRQSRTI